jgi:hypothetical protein
LTLSCRRVLIVTSSYGPTMIADMHRARQLAWEMPELGWEVEILCPDASYQQPSCVDEDSAAFFAPDTLTHFVSQWRPAVFRALRFGSIGWRALLPMLRAGVDLLRKRRFDLVYFSTTQFPLFLLGSIWRRRFGVPFVLDFHDPCYNERTAFPVWARPSLKHAISRWTARHVESHATTAAAGLVAVSPNYVQMLRRRYERTTPAWLDADRHAVIPFSVLPRDLDEAAKGTQHASEGTPWPVRIAYVGAGGPIMLRSFSLICRALSHLREQGSELVEGARIELYGTMLGWRDGDRRHLADLANEQGVADLITEHPRRVSYRRSLELLLESDGALILGVDDAGYMPSKLFSYALSGKPLLAALRRDSPAFAQFQSTPGLGHALWFDRCGEVRLPEAAQMVHAFLHEAAARLTFDRRAALEPFVAPAMARRHAELFSACLELKN